MFSEFLCGLFFALIGFSKLHDSKTAINDSFLVDAYAELEVVEIEAPLKPVFTVVTRCVGTVKTGFIGT